MLKHTAKLADIGKSGVSPGLVCEPGVSAKPTMSECWTSMESVSENGEEDEVLPLPVDLVKPLRELGLGFSECVSLVRAYYEARGHSRVSITPGGGSVSDSVAGSPVSKSVARRDRFFEKEDRLPLSYGYSYLAMVKRGKRNYWSNFLGDYPLVSKFFESVSPDQVDMELWGLLRAGYDAARNTVYVSSESRAGDDSLTTIMCAFFKLCSADLRYINGWDRVFEKMESKGFVFPNNGGFLSSCSFGDSITTTGANWSVAEFLTWDFVGGVHKVSSAGAYLEYSYDFSKYKGSAEWLDFVVGAEGKVKSRGICLYQDGNVVVPPAVIKSAGGLSIRVRRSEVGTSVFKLEVWPEDSGSVSDLLSVVPMVQGVPLGPSDALDEVSSFVAHLKKFSGTQVVSGSGRKADLESRRSEMERVWRGLSFGASAIILGKVPYNALDVWGPLKVSFDLFRERLSFFVLALLVYIQPVEGGVGKKGRVLGAYNKFNEEVEEFLGCFSWE